MVWVLRRRVVRPDGALRNGRGGVCQVESRNATLGRVGESEVGASVGLHQGGSSKARLRWGPTGEHQEIKEEEG